MYQLPACQFTDLPPCRKHQQRPTDNRDYTKKICIDSLWPQHSNHSFHTRLGRRSDSGKDYSHRGLPGNLCVFLSRWPLAGLRSCTGKNTSSNKTLCKNFSDACCRLPDVSFLRLQSLQPDTSSLNAGPLSGVLAAQTQASLGRVGPHATGFALNLET